MPISAKQARFVAEYLIDLNATQAAIRAGYSKKTADVQGPRLLGNVAVSHAVADGTRKQLERADLSAARVLEEYRRLAFIDCRSFLDGSGNLKPVSEWTDEQGAALASFEVIIKNAEAGDGKTDKVHKIKLWEKTRALDSLAKHFNLLTEQVHHTGELKLTWQS